MKAVSLISGKHSEAHGENKVQHHPGLQANQSSEIISRRDACPYVQLFIYSLNLAIEIESLLLLFCLVCYHVIRLVLICVRSAAS